MGRLVDPVPYREAADMPEVKIKKEWYCTLDGASDSENWILGTTIPAGMGAIIWLLAFVINVLSWDGDMKDNYILLRGLVLIFVYMLIWSAIFMRRREVKE